MTKNRDTYLEACAAERERRSASDVPAQGASAKPKYIPPQPVWPTKGDKMIFLGKNGYPLQLEAALKIFTVGDEYTVHDCDVQSFSHSIAFEGVKGRFNGVMFSLTSAQCGEG